jgi:hypothetical protein
MRYTITFPNLAAADVNVLANALQARPWAEANPFMQALMQQVQEQEHAAAVLRAPEPEASAQPATSPVAGEG